MTTGCIVGLVSPPRSCQGKFTATGYVCGQASVQHSDPFLRHLARDPELDVSIGQEAFRFLTDSVQLVPQSLPDYLRAPGTQ